MVHGRFQCGARFPLIRSRRSPELLLLQFFFVDVYSLQHDIKDEIGSIVLVCRTVVVLQRMAHFRLGVGSRAADEHHLVSRAGTSSAVCGVVSSRASVMRCPVNTPVAPLSGKSRRQRCARIIFWVSRDGLPFCEDVAVFRELDACGPFTADMHWQCAILVIARTCAGQRQQPSGK